MSKRRYALLLVAIVILLASCGRESNDESEREPDGPQTTDSGPPTGSSSDAISGVVPEGLAFERWAEVSAVELPGGRVRILRSRSPNAPWSCYVDQAFDQTSSGWVPAEPFQIPTKSVLDSTSNVENLATCIHDDVFASDGAYVIATDNWSSDRRLAIAVVANPEVRVNFENKPADGRLYTEGVGVFLDVDRSILEDVGTRVTCEAVTAQEASCSIRSAEVLND